MCLFSIHIASSVKCLFNSFAVFDGFSSCYWTFKSSLYIPDTSSLLNICIVNIFFSLCPAFSFSWWWFFEVQFSSVVQSCPIFATPWTAARQASLSITNSWSVPKPMSIELVMPSNHLILCRPLSSCLQSFPASGSFQMSQLFSSGGQSIGALASKSVLPMNTQDWSPLGWTRWISLQSKGCLGVFSNTTVQKHQFFCAQLSL